MGQDGTTRLWDLDTKLLFRKESNLKLFKQKANLLAFSDNEKVTAHLEKDGSIWVSNLSNVQQLTSPVKLSSKAIKESLLSPDGHKVQANVNNSESGELADRLFLEGLSEKGLPENKLIDLDETQHNGEVVNFSDDSNLMAKVDYDGVFKLWDVWGNQKLIEFNASQNIKKITFSSDGSLLATVTENDTISLWQVGGLDELISWSCQRVGNYLKNSNADVAESDKALCDDISEIKKAGKISTGDKILVPVQTPTHPDKQAGVDALTFGDFEQAIASLTAYLKQEKNPNDPEAQIYLNNAKIGNQESSLIAVSVPISSNVNDSLEILRGVAQAQDEFNSQEGILPIRVLISDDHNDPEIAKQIAKNLADNRDVLGVVGHFSSSVTREAAQVYNDKKLVAISPVSTSVKLSNVLGRYVFRTVPNDKVAAEKLVGYTLNSLNRKKAVLFYNSKSEYSQSLKSQFKTAFASQGGEVLNEIDLSTTEFSSKKSLKNLDKNTALVLLADNSKINQVFEVVKANHGKLPILAGDDVYGFQILKFFHQHNLPISEGLVIAIPWHIGNNRGSNFSTISTELWGDRDINWRTVTAYDAAKALMTAIKQNPRREEIANILRTDSFTAQGAT